MGRVLSFKCNCVIDGRVIEFLHPSLAHTYARLFPQVALTRPDVLSLSTAAIQFEICVCLTLDKMLCFQASPSSSMANKCTRQSLKPITSLVSGFAPYSIGFVRWVQNDGKDVVPNQFTIKTQLENRLN